MDPFATPLVLTKLRVPAARARLISRRLAPASGARLVLVCAPAGYGKTTFLAEWARELAAGGTAAAWVALGPEDDSPAVFGSYLAASLMHALGPLPELAQAAQLLRGSPEVDLLRVLPEVINAVMSSGRECVLVLDDYHVIGSPAVHSAVTYLLEHLPENLRLVIGSRSDPPLPLARLRARGQLFEIRTAALRFSSAEAAQYLNEVMGLGLSEQGAAALTERTEGWIAGLQLAALSVSGRADKEAFIAAYSGSQRYLVDYLMEEVVRGQPQAVQDFLLSTCVLERMCGALCNALSGANGGAETLMRLEQHNLFVVALDDQGDWYRYHHLFRDFLQAALKKNRPDAVAGLHRAACEWLAGQNLLREAARHAFAAGDWEYAAGFVEQHSFTLIVHSEIAEIYEWCAAFPEEVIQRHPMIGLQQGLALAYAFRRQNRGRVAARLAQAESAIAAISDRQNAQGLIDMAVVVKTFLAFAPDPAADPRAGLALAEEITGAYPDGNPGQFSGLLVKGYAHLALQDATAAREALEMARQIAVRERLFFGIVESSFHLARLAQAQGDLPRVEEICQQAREDLQHLLPNAEQVLPAIGSLDAALGCTRLAQGRLDEAEALLRGGLERMGAAMNPYYLWTAYDGLFRLYETLERPEEALRALERLETVWPDTEFYTGGLRALSWLEKDPGSPAARTQAADWCQALAASTGLPAFEPGLGPYGAAEVYAAACLAWAKIQLLLGAADGARAYCRQQIERAAGQGLARRMADLTALLEPAGSGVSVGHSPTAAGRGAPLAGGESLSERELEVLRLIAGGATNGEVARRLVITVGTVKSHMNHILGKLDAHNRTEAVARARSLGLLEL